MGKETIIAVSVPIEDAKDLEQLIGESDSPPPIESRGLDGQTVVTVLLPFFLPVLPLVKTWITARVQQRKGCTVSIEGRKFNGYTADEVVKILEALEKAASEKEASAELPDTPHGSTGE